MSEDWKPMFAHSLWAALVFFGGMALFIKNDWKGMAAIFFAFALICIRWAVMEWHTAKEFGVSPWRLW